MDKYLLYFFYFFDHANPDIMIMIIIQIHQDHNRTNAIHLAEPRLWVKRSLKNTQPWFMGYSVIFIILFLFLLLSGGWLSLSSLGICACT